MRRRPLKDDAERRSVSSANPVVTQVITQGCLASLNLCAYRWRRCSNLVEWEQRSIGRELLACAADPGRALPRSSRALAAPLIGMDEFACQ